MKIVDRALMESLSAQAATCQRLRTNHNLHPSLKDPVQRLLNAVEPGSYVRPHRHPDPGRWELFLALSGAAVMLTFDGRGTVIERAEFRARGPVQLVEVPPETWHSLVSLEAGTVLFELKPGPYTPISDKDFAPWAPAEGESACAAFEAWFRRALPGEGPPRL